MNDPLINLTDLSDLSDYAGMMVRMRYAREALLKHFSFAETIDPDSDINVMLNQPWSRRKVFQAWEILVPATDVHSAYWVSSFAESTNLVAAYAGIAPYRNDGASPYILILSKNLEIPCQI